VDGQEILRALAVEHQRDIEGVGPQYRQTLILASRRLVPRILRRFRPKK
jgi:hypothetical protein